MQPRRRHPIPKKSRPGSTPRPPFLTPARIAYFIFHLIVLAVGLLVIKLTADYLFANF